MAAEIGLVKARQLANNLLGIIDAVDHVAEFSRTGQSADIPAKMLARAAHADIEAIMIHHTAIMFDNQVKLRVDRRIGASSPVLNQCITCPSNHGLP